MDDPQDVEEEERIKEDRVHHSSAWVKSDALVTMGSEGGTYMKKLMSLTGGTEFEVMYLGGEVQ